MLTKSEKNAATIMLRDTASMYGKNLTTFQIEIYLRALEDFSLSQIAKGLSAMSSNSAFLPKPVEVKEWIEKNLCGGSRKDWGEKWMRELINYFNGRCFTICEDPCFGKAFKQIFGSMHYLGRSKADDETLVKKFLAVYKVITEATLEDALIPGNSKDKEPPLRYLGDWHKCDAIARQLFPERRNFPVDPDKTVKIEAPKKDGEEKFVPPEVIKATLEQLLREMQVAK